MDLRNCPQCGRAFAYKGIDLCSRCQSTDEEDFKKVKEYLYDHPGATIMEVVEGTGVTEKQVLRYLRESRIEIREKDNLLLDCQRCSQPIQSGRFCEKCVGEMKKEFTAAVKPSKETKEEPKEKSSNVKMHIAEIRKKLK